MIVVLRKGMNITVSYSNAFELYRNNEKRVEKWVSYFMQAIPEPDKKVLLDCGCGVGRFTVPLSVSFMRTFGVDKDSSMLNVARKKNSSVNWIEADAYAIPLPDHSIDVVLASMLIEHLGSLDKFLCEISRLVKKDGVLLIRTMLPGDIDNTTWYSFSEKACVLEKKRTYDLESLVESLASYGFELSQECSIFHESEYFSNSNVVMRLSSKCYEIIHHLDEDDYNEMIDKAKEWERISSKEEIMSSSLLVFMRGGIPDDKLL